LLIEGLGFKSDQRIAFTYRCAMFGEGKDCKVRPGLCIEFDRWHGVFRHHLGFEAGDHFERLMLDDDFPCTQGGRRDQAKAKEVPSGWHVWKLRRGERDEKRKEAYSL